MGHSLPRLVGPSSDGSGALFVLGFGALAFATLAVITPWLMGNLLDIELSPGYTGVMTVVVGTAFGVAGGWLVLSPFRRLAWFSIIVMGFLALLFLFSLGRWAVRRDVSRRSSS